MASDNFTRANESPIASPWAVPTGFGTMKLASNAVTATTASTDSACRYTLSTATDSQVTIGTVGSSDGGPAIFDASGNGYSANGAGGNISVLRFAGGAFSATIGSTAGSWASGNTVRIRRVGNTLVVSINGADVLTSASDTTYMTGNPAIHNFDGTETVTAWTDNVAPTDVIIGQACL